MRSALGLLVTLLAVTTVLQGDASAARRHRRNHRRGPLICPSDTQAINGRCIPIIPPGPPADPIGNVKIVPSVIKLTPTPGSSTTGDFSVIGVSVTGLPASVPVTVASPQLAAACAPGKAIIAGISGPDATGRLTFNLSGVTCKLGSYAINFTEAVAPNQTFTAFVKLVY